MSAEKEQVVRYEVLSEYLGGNTNYLCGHVSTVVLASDYDARGVLVLALKARIKRLETAMHEIVDNYGGEGDHRAPDICKRALAKVTDSAKPAAMDRAAKHYGRAMDAAAGFRPPGCTCAGQPGSLSCPVHGQGIVRETTEK